jgi:hypothetical protein
VYRWFQGASLNPLVPIGAASLVCLMPLALYFLFLAHLNYRQRPALLSGPWDFTFLLLGLSGFLMIGGPVLLSVFDSTWRSFYFEGNFKRLNDVWHRNSLIWPMVATGYVITMIVLIVYGLHLRRSVSIVYNLKPGSLEEILVKAVELCELDWRKALGGIEIGIPKKERATIDEGDRREHKADPNRSFHRAAFVQIEAFPAFFNASMKWNKFGFFSDPLLRKEVETRIQKILQSTESPPNRVGSWLMTTAVSIFVTMLLWMGFLIWTVFSRQKMV